MTHPVFICFEASGYSERSYPIALGWTLHDGCYKSIFIKPEDDWTEWDANLESHLSKTREDLYQLGEPALDVIRELDLDVEQGIVYVEDTDAATLWLEALYNAYDKDIPFEIKSLFELFPEINRSDFDEERRYLLESNNLSFSSAEDQVLVMQRLWADFGQKQR
ncbi:hypothetical protein [Gynuella sp.]|uniref:hypothetical protein n=1 Tax=Gynuella sp. TaxID=2969146 RepID=UPI003D0EA046